MKKLLLIPALLLSSALMAKEYKYEITPVIGYNIAEGNLNLENQFLVGAEFQVNTDTFLEPEFSILFTDTDYENLAVNPSTNIWRAAFNGVHDIDAIGAFTPLLKVGVGYESIENNLADNDDALFIDAGVGVKTSITEQLALKFEAVYMNKEFDSNFAILAGLNYSFGEKAQKEAPVETKAVQVKPEPKPVVKKAPVAPIVIDGDDDKDGVLNSVDECPNTPAGNVVNANGCTARVDLHINFENDSFEVDKSSKVKVQNYANFLNTRKNFTTNIVGHTSTKGSANYNQKLSEKRAEAVKSLLIKDGVKENRIFTIGKGESEPIVNGNTQDAHAQNRRIEAELTKH